MKALPNRTPHELCDTLKRLDRRRAFFVYDSDTHRVRASHPALQELATHLNEHTPDLDEHEAIFLQVSPSTGALMGAFLHKTIRGQGAGGLRHWPYDDTQSFLRDGLRLARGMGRKNALAGLWWGGGKGVIARQDDAYRDEEYRARLYRDYGQFTTSLRGAYVTAEDVGTRPADMAEVFRTTRYVTCVPAEVGGSGNPSPWTARGVVCAMESALEYLGLGTLAGKTVAMQGVGNVGQSMIAELLERRVARVVASDISETQLDQVRRAFTSTQVELRLAAPGDWSILSEPCDVLAPNALGGVLNPDTIPHVKAPIVCGAANNQLFDDTRDDTLLDQRGITFVPDFVANRMGIVNCANEQYGTFPNDPAIFRHFDRSWENSVHAVTQRVLVRAKHTNTTSTAAANSLADELMRELHPIWGHRTRRIIEALIASRWDEA